MVPLDLPQRHLAQLANGLKFYGMVHAECKEGNSIYCGFANCQGKIRFTF